MELREKLEKRLIRYFTDSRIGPSAAEFTKMKDAVAVALEVVEEHSFQTGMVQKLVEEVNRLKAQLEQKEMSE